MAKKKGPKDKKEKEPAPAKGKGKKNETPANDDSPARGNDDTNDLLDGLLDADVDADAGGAGTPPDAGAKNDSNE